MFLAVAAAIRVPVDRKFARHWAKGFPWLAWSSKRQTSTDSRGSPGETQSVSLR
jgi:hypothetical protein